MTAKYNKILRCIGLFNCAIREEGNYTQELDDSRQLAFIEYDELIRLAEIGLKCECASKFMED